MSLRKALPYPQPADFEVPDNGHRWLELVHQRVIDFRCIFVTFNPASIVANTTVEQTVTVSGLKSDDIIVSVVKRTLTAGFGVLQGRVSSDNTLAIQLVNASIGAINAPSETYTVIYIKNSKV